MNLSFILLQITTAGTGAAADTVAVASESNELSFLDLVMKGGFMMIPIFLLSLISIYLFVERFLYIRQNSKIDKNLIPEIKSKLKDGKVKEAIEYCERSPYPIARIVQKGLYRLGSPIRDIEAAVENMANIQISHMEKNLSFLAAIAAVAPMVGFLGTVSGMIRAFHSISIQGNISIGVIAGGIYEKMVTSAAGLIVGVIAHILFTYLNNMIDRSASDMELAGMEFIDILNRPAA
jgi:biopolymer transport protein ExbB